MSNSTASSRTPLASLSILVALALGAYLILPNVLIVLVTWVTDISLVELLSAIKTDPPEARYQWVLLIVQFLASSISFIVVPLFFIKRISREHWGQYFVNDKHDSKAYLILFFLTISCMTVNALFIEWNLTFTFPEPLQSIFRELEQEMEVTTNFLTDFQSFPYFILSILAIAVVPAVGEELLFRGLIQKYATQIFGNIHVAIWLTAIVFSAFHLQFFGFIPRMLLGAFFGYLVYFSGSLWYGIAAHFVNNGFSVLMLYLHQQGQVDFDIENTDSISLETVAIFAIIGVILFVSFVRQFQKEVNHN